MSLHTIRSKNEFFWHRQNHPAVLLTGASHLKIPPLRAGYHAFKRSEPARKIVFTSHIFYVLISILVFVLFPLAAQAASLKALLSFPDKFERQTVVVEGEVIGEVMRGHDGFWLNLSSEGYGIGIFSGSPQRFAAVEQGGNYRYRGDYLRVEGVFYKHCLQHGERDIHLQTLEVLEKARPRQEEVSSFKLEAVKLLSLICLTMLVIYLIKVIIIKWKLKHGRAT